MLGLLDLRELGELLQLGRLALANDLPCEARRDSPPTDDAPFDFVALPTGQDRRAALVDGQRVLLAAADRHILEGALGLAREAKLRSLSLTVAAHDLVAWWRPNGTGVWCGHTGQRARPISSS